MRKHTLFKDTLDILEQRGMFLPLLKELPFVWKDKNYNYKARQVDYAEDSGGVKRETIGNLPLVLMEFEQYENYEEQNKDIQGHSCGYFVPAEDARNYLWKTYNINLACLSSYLSIKGYDLAKPENRNEILKRGYGIDPVARYALGDIVSFYAHGNVTNNTTSFAFPHTTKTEFYYTLDDVAVIAAAFKLKMIETPAPCSIYFSEVTEKENKAFVAYYDHDNLEPIAWAVPLSGFMGKMAINLEMLFILRYRAYFIEEMILQDYDELIKSIRNRLERLSHSTNGMREDMSIFMERMKQFKNSGTISPHKFEEYLQKNLAVSKSIEDSSQRVVAFNVDEKIQEIVDMRDRARAKQPAGVDDTEENKKIKKLKQEYADINKVIGRLYFEFGWIAEEKREEIISKCRALATVRSHRIKVENNPRERDAYTKMASTMRTVNPHMSVLPAGLTSLIRPPKQGPLAEAIVRVQRAVYGQDNPVQLNLHLGEEEKEMPDLMKAVDAIFGPLNLNWLALLGYVGLCKIYDQQNGYNINTDIETSCSEFWKTIRPGAIERINKKGLEDWWRKGHETKKDMPGVSDLYLFVMKFFSSLNLPTMREKKKGTIYGLTQISAVTQNRHGHPDVKWRFNPNLEDYIKGPNPLYMVVNHDAMFSYEGKELYAAPALQLYLEDQTRRNVYKGLYELNQGTLLTPDKDGYLLGTLAERIGLPNTVKPSRNIERIVSALETVKKAGVLKEFKIGRTRQDPYQTKVEMTVADTYQDLYHLARIKNKEDQLIRDLQKPFAPKKKTKPK